jgi:hypothetical protein
LARLVSGTWTDERNCCTVSPGESVGSRGAIHHAFDLHLKYRDHTALFDPGFKEAVSSLDQQPLVFGP